MDGVMAWSLAVRRRRQQVVHGGADRASGTCWPLAKAADAVERRSASRPGSEHLAGEVGELRAFCGFENLDQLNQRLPPGA
jgi:hypothetical protein